MLIATAELLSAAIGRWPLIWALGPIENYGVTGLIVLGPLLTYDIVTRRRLHPATLWGGLFLIGSQILRTVLAQTDLWLNFAQWVKG